jgi:release factor glutamine methyltransferase
MRAELHATRRELLDEGTATLAAAGAASPRREAHRLWLELSGGQAGIVAVSPGRAVAAELAAAFVGAVRRRAAGEPLAHVIGQTGFRHLTLRSDARALIPRPETEGLVELVLARVRSGRIADIGTGSGCIALSLATEGSFEQVLAVDRSAAALALAAENRGAVGARVDLLRGDLVAPLRPAGLDALVSNPPYLTAGEYAALDRAVRDWEPRVALESGADGLEASARLLDEGRAVVRLGGWLALEVDCTRAGQCAAQAAALGWSDVAVHADLFGRERYLLARRSDAL